jgi:aminobenzoyl-glutamate utilization protein B
MTHRILVAVIMLGLHAAQAFAQPAPPAQDIAPAPASLSPEKKLALDWLSRDDVSARFGRIADSIWSFAELGLQEHKSSALLIETLEREGFTVEKGLAGMPTCFVASFGSGKPVIGILAEYDALPMISQKAFSVERDPVIDGAPGHGCGHNMMGPAAAAAAIAVKRSIEQHGLSGTIKYFGSPAEEMLVSRPYMIRAGLFDGVDAVINNHAAAEFRTDYGVRGSAAFSVVFRFEGKTAHGASAWGGRSALDGVEIMNVATNFLREHLHFTHRMHYVIPRGGEAPNVVPDKASVWYYLRGTDERMPETFERVVNCAKGAALASGTTLAEVRVIAATHQAHHNQALAAVIDENIRLVGMPTWSSEEQEFALRLQSRLGANQKGMPTEVGRLELPEKVFTGGASSDHGDVTLVVPTATVRFPGKVPGVSGHHWSTVACGFGSAAHKGLNAGAKAMAGTAIDLLTRQGALAAIRSEFDAYSKKYPYKSFLPENAEPPLDMNLELMKQFIPLMQPHYVEDER